MNLVELLLGEATMMVIHIGALICVISIYRGAPCWLQKLAVGLWAVSLLLYAGKYGAEMLLHDHQLARSMKIIALTMEHLGLLVYVFRIAYREHVECKSSHRLSSH